MNSFVEIGYYIRIFIKTQQVYYNTFLLVVLKNPFIKNNNCADNIPRNSNDLLLVYCHRYKYIFVLEEVTAGEHTLYYVKKYVIPTEIQEYVGGHVKTIPALILHKTFYTFNLNKTVFFISCGPRGFVAFKTSALRNSYYFQFVSKLCG